ncbi:hypothetical protein SCLCIDRAFT_13535 [Scleroderma citrinum Foug A]|uniref:TLC domain-containing protein n=1 Tax=Scleroderma citrinum Foug A TaxID=1036808 RepID=A0A0C3E7N3_9AGAM|nr:hypothetical protein SCLCIDRAFT_13535 [Scleroderma citrinum Foug A]
MSKRSLATPKLLQRRGKAGNLRSIEPLDTPDSNSSPRYAAFYRSKEEPSFWSDLKTWKWVVNPASSFKMLVVPIILFLNWELLGHFVAPNLPNPFGPLLFISYPITSKSGEARYAKGYLDLAFIAYYIIFFSFLRQVVTIRLCQRIARYFKIKRRSQLDRFGEQAYALAYFAIMGSWGVRNMIQLPTNWYRTEYFWIDYPHWEMIPELKRYYLMHTAYWLQQFMVLLLRLEKPRKDYTELVIHHIVTLWLIGWSYLVNMTLIGNAVYTSMDIPDAFLAFSKILNYIKWERSKTVSFLLFLVSWTYFRHYLNIRILWSVWTEFDLVPETARIWAPETGAWLVYWMKYQIFMPLFLLQVLNLFWYYLIWRVAIRSMTNTLTDVRSDDEDNGDDDANADKDE